MQAQMKATVVAELEGFFAETSRLIVAVQIYAESLVKAVGLIEKQGKMEDALFSVRYILQQTPHFLATRDRLSTLSAEVHRKFGKNYLLLSTAWGATNDLQQATKAVTEIAEFMWIRVPYINPDDPRILDLFLSQINLKECYDLISCSKRNYNFINAAIGSIRGKLLAPIIGLNFVTVLGFLWNKSQIKEFIEALKSC